VVPVLIGAVTTHIVDHHPLYQSVEAPIHLAIMVIVMLATWPADWRDPFRSRATITSRGSTGRRRESSERTSSAA
jgi:hypothetical protein